MSWSTSMPQDISVSRHSWCPAGTGQSRVTLPRARPPRTPLCPRSGPACRRGDPGPWRGTRNVTFAGGLVRGGREAGPQLRPGAVLQEEPRAAGAAPRAGVEQRAHAVDGERVHLRPERGRWGSRGALRSHKYQGEREQWARVHVAQTRAGGKMHTFESVCGRSSAGGNTVARS